MYLTGIYQTQRIFFTIQSQAELYQSDKKVLATLDMTGPGGANELIEIALADISEIESEDDFCARNRSGMCKRKEKKKRRRSNFTSLTINRFAFQDKIYKGEPK